MRSNLIRSVAVSAALVVAGAGVAVGLSTAAAATLGVATVSPSTGGVDTLFDLNTAGPCVAPAVKVRVVAFGFGFPAEGQTLYTPTTLNFSTTMPMVVPVNNAFRTYAEQNSNTALVGPYDIRVQCVNSLATTVFDEYTATLNWTTPGNSFSNINSATYTTTAPPTTPPVVLAPVKLTSPFISGTAKVGAAIYCKNGTWSNNPTSITYQWLRDGSPVSGATSYKRILSSFDYAKSFRCRVTATNAGGSTPTDSGYVKVAAGTFTALKAPSISGTAKVGLTLSSYKGSWAPTPSSTTYQWLRNGAPIKYATKSSYKVTTSDRSRTISLKVTVKATGYTTVSKVTAGKKAY